MQFASRAGRYIDYVRRDGSWRLCGVADEGLERTIQEAREMS